jgi:hypothetical protein
LQQAAVRILQPIPGNWIWQEPLSDVNGSRGTRKMKLISHVRTLTAQEPRSKKHVASPALVIRGIS